MENQPQAEGHKPIAMYPGIELSRTIRDRIIGATRREGLVEKSVLAVVSKAVEERRGDVMVFVQEMDDSNVVEVAAEFIGSSMMLADSGSSGLGFGLSGGSDWETLILGSTGMAKDVGDEYALRMKERHNIKVEQAFVEIVPHISNAPMGVSDVYRPAGFSLADNLANPGTLTKIMMARMVWGNEAILKDIKRQVPDQDLAWLGLYGAMSENPWMLRSGLKEDPEKYGAGGNRAILNCLDMVIAMTGDRNFYGNPEEMTAKMLEKGLIGSEAANGFLRAMSDYVLIRSARRPSDLVDQNLVQGLIPDNLRTKDQMVHTIRADRKSVMQTYFGLRDGILSPLGFGSRTAVDFKSWEIDRQIAYALAGDSQSLELRATAGIWLTRDVRVVQQLYDAMPKKSWLAGLGVSKFVPIKRGQNEWLNTQRTMHHDLIKRVEKDNETLWGNEQYLNSTTRKTVQALGYES